MQDKLQELKEVFGEILTDDPDAINPYNNLGVKLRRSGDYLGALHAYNQALVLTPTDENLHYNIAKAHIYAGDTQKALGHLREAVVIRGDFREASALIKKLEGAGGDADNDVANAQPPGGATPEPQSGSRLPID
jgi:tetratricopeptide (TPR) repeat protein